MNPEEQTVTWLISLGVLSSPKKNIADPEEFLKTSLKDGVVLCKLSERLVPGFTPKYCQDPRTEADCISNIKEFLKGCSSLKVEVTVDFLIKFFKTNFEITTELFENKPAICQVPETYNRNLLMHLDVLLSGCDDLSQQEMSENGGGGQLMVKARFNFKQNNEDELSFNKGEVILVTRQEEGGWWEGTLNGKTGWFPSNYVREIKPCEKPLSPKGTQLTKNYYSVVVQDILEHEREFLKELQTVLNCYLRPLQSSDKLSSADSATLCGNLEDINSFQQGLCLALEECTKVPEGQQRVAACYLNLMCQIKALYLAYCSSHPSAVCILTDHSEELEKFMESHGASTGGVMTLTTSLSKPFMRLEKYPTLLQELERHVEEAHPDYTDIVKATAAFRSLLTQCQDLRKRKNLELQILSEPVRGWEGESMKSLGQVAYTSLVHVRNGCSEEKEERYLMLFPNVLVMLSASPRMSGFIYQGRLPLTGTTVTRHAEEGDISHFAFDITGSMIERITVFCSSAQELQEWLEHLQPFTKGGSPASTISKVRTETDTRIHKFKTVPKNADGKPVSMISATTHPHHQGSFSSVSRGPLEPPKISKPWSLSCLRPAPPLKPSAALGYKEDTSKSPRPMRFLPGNRRKERKTSDDDIHMRKSTVALEEDAQILRVIEAYCTGASLHQSTTGVYALMILALSLFCVCVCVCVYTAVRKECVPQVLLPEEEKIIVEEMKSNGQTALIYLNFVILHNVWQENKWMKQFLEEEQKSRKELERLVRKLAKQKNDCGWDDGAH
uniref:Rac/Cdc42 guanine nucleotide exchange factor (GEF) 6 n=1 Tax=Astatotilapia calliptera TaxID=8154 RepID=A0A3P8N681_ASTCA